MLSFGSFGLKNIGVGLIGLTVIIPLFMFILDMGNSVASFFGYESAETKLVKKEAQVKQYASIVEDIKKDIIIKEKVDNLVDNSVNDLVKEHKVINEIKDESKINIISKIAEIEKKESEQINVNLDSEKKIHNISLKPKQSIRDNGVLNSHKRQNSKDFEGIVLTKDKYKTINTDRTLHISKRAYEEISKISMDNIYNVYNNIEDK